MSNMSGLSSYGANSSGPQSYIGISLVQHGFNPNSDDEWVIHLNTTEILEYRKIKNNFNEIDNALNSFNINIRNQQNNDMTSNEAQRALNKREWENKKTQFLQRSNMIKNQHIERLNNLKQLAHTNLMAKNSKNKKFKNNSGNTRQNKLSLNEPKDVKPTQEELLAALKRVKTATPSTSSSTTTNQSNVNPSKNNGVNNSQKGRQEKRKRTRDQEEEDIIIMEKPRTNFDYYAYIDKMNAINNTIKPVNTLNSAPPPIVAGNNLSSLLDECIKSQQLLNVPSRQPPPSTSNEDSYLHSNCDIDYRSLIQRPKNSVPRSNGPTSTKVASPPLQSDMTHMTSDLANTIMHPPPPPPVEPEARPEPKPEPEPEPEAEPEPPRDMYLDNIRPEDVFIFEKLRSYVEKYNCRDRLVKATEAIRNRINFMGALDAIESVAKQNRVQKKEIHTT